MPIYEYKCKNCDNIFDEFVLSASTPDSHISCPECNKKDVEKLISTISIGAAANSNSSLPCGSNTCSTGGFT